MKSWADVFVAYLTAMEATEFFLKVKSNRGAGGIDKMSVDELLPYLREHRLSLLQQIKDGKYKPNPVRRVEIPKEEKGKKGYGERH